MNLIKEALKRILPECVQNALRYVKRALTWKNVPILVLITGEACNLKCKNCGNFCPRAKRDMLRYDVNDIISDMNIFLQNVKSINSLQVQGGEPFLYSDLEKLLAFLGEQKKIKNIKIATNGTIIPSDVHGGDCLKTQMHSVESPLNKPKTTLNMDSDG